jgi:hypothetical protein
MQTELPAGKRTIGSKWVFKTKFRADGSIERHKARLVAKEYTQRQGIDYLETFSPVVKLTTVRVLMVVAAVNQLHIHQLDVNSAFLNGDLMEEVYMKPPEGLPVPTKTSVCRLLKSIYGLKQSSRQWNVKLTQTLRKFGFIQSKSDHSLFTKASSSGFPFVLVYVDDLLIAGANLESIQSLKNMLHQEFNIKDLGQMKYFLGFKVARSKLRITMCQRKYALDLVKDAGLTATKPKETPMEVGLKLKKDSANIISDITSYRRMVGRLLYLTHTRLDIAFAVGRLIHFLSCPTKKHFNAAIRVLKYIKRSPQKVYFFQQALSFLS